MKGLVLLSLSLAITACAASPPHPRARVVRDGPSSQPVATTAPAMSPDVQLYAMNCGDMELADIDSYADDGSMKGVRRRFIDPCYLIHHPTGYLLWDTGVPMNIAETPGGTWPEGDSVHIVVKKKLTAQLAELGLRPSDITFLSLSHMHFDHAGNANLFAGSTWIVDENEREAMFAVKARSDAGEFARYDALEHAKTVLIRGKDGHDVFGDGSVVIHGAPGHTPGHAVLLVRTAHSGPVLLTGDLWHLAESRERRLVPSFNFSREQTLASMDEVEALARSTGARIVRQHVPEDFTALPLFPLPLE